MMVPNNGSISIREFGLKVRSIVSVLQSNKDFLYYQQHSSQRRYLSDTYFRAVFDRDDYSVRHLVEITSELAKVVNQFYGVNQAMEILNDALRINVASRVHPYDPRVFSVVNDRITSVEEYRQLIELCRQEILRTNQTRNWLNQRYT